MTTCRKARPCDLSARAGRRPNGFTLIELLVVLAILGVMATLAFPIAETASRRSKERELRESLREIRSAIDRYKAASEEGRIDRMADQSGYPPSLFALVDGVTDRKSPTGAKLHFLRRVPIDPMTHDDKTVRGAWALRSHRSSPDDPQPGEDVFDVFSRSKGVGLNGVPYAQW